VHRHHGKDAAGRYPTGCHGRGPEKLNQFLNLSSFAEQMLVHENAIVKIRKDMPLELAALIGCGVITGYGAVVNTAKVTPARPWS
jgi:Zn-dependent alcohol dehydrogenase